MKKKPNLEEIKQPAVSVGSAARWVGHGSGNAEKTTRMRSRN